MRNKPQLSPGPQRPAASIGDGVLIVGDTLALPHEAARAPLDIPLSSRAARRPDADTPRPEAEGGAEVEDVERGEYGFESLHSAPTARA